MQITKTITKTFTAMYLAVLVYPEDWEDAVVGGVKDVNGLMVPHRIGFYWSFQIVIDTGQVVDWPEGTRVVVRYLIREGEYWLLDESGTSFHTQSEMPEMLCADGYTGRLAITIDENGCIENWKPNPLDFQGKEDASWVTKH